MAGTDRGATWLALLYAASVAVVVGLLTWRFGGHVLRSPRVAVAGLVTVVALTALILGPLHHSAAAWNSARVDESLTGSVIRNGTQLQQIVSFVGQGGRPQRLLVRADLLVSPQRLESTSLQLEYLPSGDVCRGKVTSVGGASFEGTCRMPTGQHRTIEASWQPSEDGTGVIGEIHLRA
jgi:hypothetical protein